MGVPADGPETEQMGGRVQARSARDRCPGVARQTQRVDHRAQHQQAQKDEGPRIFGPEPALGRRRQRRERSEGERCDRDTQTGRQFLHGGVESVRVREVGTIDVGERETVVRGESDRKSVV